MRFWGDFSVSEDGTQMWTHNRKLQQLDGLPDPPSSCPLPPTLPLSLAHTGAGCLGGVTECQGTLKMTLGALTFLYLPLPLLSPCLLAPTCHPGEGVEHPSSLYCIYLGVAENRGQPVSQSLAPPPASSEPATGWIWKPLHSDSFLPALSLTLGGVELITPSSGSYMSQTCLPAYVS